MASSLPTLASLLLTLSLLSLSVAGEPPSYATTTNLKPKELRRKEKLTHFKFFWHDIYSGTSPSAAAVVQPPNKSSPTGFGAISMIDDPLTVGPELGSKLIGKAQGLYGIASQTELALVMAMNFVFSDGAYNGSTISVLGRNSIASELREMPVIGGTGMFRFARGYVEARTFKFDAKLGDATVEYNVYVLHR